MPRRTVLKLTLIFVGSGVGGILRYAVAGFVQNLWRPTFPLGTLIVNLSGCLAIGFLATALSGSLVREEYRIAILIGVLGGYTTFSTFGRETLSLLQDGQWLAAVVNILLSNLLGLIGVWAGWALAVRIYGEGP